MKSILREIESNTNMEQNVSLFKDFTKGEKKEFLTHLKELKNEAAGIFLNKIYVNEEDKEIQKLIKKLLFRLKTIGVTIQEPHITGEPVLRGIEKQKEYRGFMTNYDGEGTRLICASFELKKKTFLFVDAITHFSDGLIELASAEVRRNDVEELINGYRRKTNRNILFVEISPRYASFLIEESAALSGRYTEELKFFKSFASHILHTIQRPDDIYTINISESITPLPIEQLLSHDLFTPFLLSWTGMDEDKKTYQSAGTETLILPSYMVEEKKDAFLRTLMEKEELKEKTHYIKRMFEDYAYIFYMLHDLAAYRGSIEMVKQKDHINDALLFFIKKSLDRPEEEQEQGIIVNPYDQIHR